MIDHIFHDLLPAQGRPFRSVLISTSSIALQNAIQTEYLPVLTDALTMDGLISEPLLAVIRKGKSHYVCRQQLEHRLLQIKLSKKNERTVEALLSLREHLDMDGVPHLTSFDRERVCVSQHCDCNNCDLVAANSISLASGQGRKLAHSVAAPLPTKPKGGFAGTPKYCRYRAFLEDCDYFDTLAAEIAALLDACWGHALVLFTLGRNAVHTTQEFKNEPKHGGAFCSIPSASHKVRC